MTIAPLPAVQTAGVAPLSFANDVRDLLELLRDTTPHIKAWVNHASMAGSGGAGEIPTGTATLAEFSDGAGSPAFNETPVENVGGFTAAGSGNKGNHPARDRPVPAGRARQLRGEHDRVPTHAAQGRRIERADGHRVAQVPTTTIGFQMYTGPTTHRCTIGDRLDVEITHNMRHRPRRRRLRHGPVARLVTVVFVDRRALATGQPPIVIDDGTTERRVDRLELTGCVLMVCDPPHRSPSRLSASRRSRRPAELSTPATVA
ncbi:MAG: hypothetical protein R2695_04170 [Acidimicrobiales bacterium]